MTLPIIAPRPEDEAVMLKRSRPATAARLWAFFDSTGRLLMATDYEAGLPGAEHALSFHHIGPFTRVEYVPRRRHRRARRTK